MERAAATALPRDFGYEWTGITFQELKAGSIATVVFALAIVFVFLILAAQYESWTMPFMVLLAVPLALVRRACRRCGCAAHADRRLFADRLRDADRPRGQERDSDRRIRQAPARGGLEHRRGRDGSGAPAAAADPDDGLRLHPRRRAADVRDRRRRGEPPIDRHDGVRRHARRDDPDAGLRAGLLRRHRAAARRARGSTKAAPAPRARTASSPTPRPRNRQESSTMRGWKLVLAAWCCSPRLRATAVYVFDRNRRERRRRRRAGRRRRTPSPCRCR